MTDVLAQLSRRHGKEPWEVNGEARQIMVQQETDLKILLGVLGNCHEGMLLSFDDGCFQLITLVPEGEPDILCQHEEWPEFIKLVAEYSDYIQGDDNG